MSDEMSKDRQYQLFSRQDPAFIVLIRTVDLLLFRAPPGMYFEAAERLLPPASKAQWADIMDSMFPPDEVVEDLDERIAYMHAMLRLFDLGPQDEYRNKIYATPWLYSVFRIVCQFEPD